MNLSVELVILIPVMAGVLSMLMSTGKRSALLSMALSGLTLIATTSMCIDVLTEGPIRYSLWYVDELSVIFVMLIAVISFMTSIYSYGYISRDIEKGHIQSSDGRIYFVLLNIFTAVMFLTCLVSSMGLLWIAIEATTLISAFLVGFYREKSSTEAAWKYLMLCSAGITLALVGITLVYAASLDVLAGTDSSLDWPILYDMAAELDPAIMKIAFVFIMIGFGTKIGLVPLHTWLPDAHSQAPTPVSALLSAVLLNCALYGLIRFKMIADVTLPGFTMYLFIGAGLISLIVAAMFIMNSTDIKRMFAYSSIEHMGIIMIGLGIGGPIAIFGVLFHIIAHSVSKSFTFLSVGNVISEYGTSDMTQIRGLRKRMPFSAFMLTAGMFAMAGLPPFAIFIGEITILWGAVSSGMYILAAVMVVFMLIVFAGSARNVLPMMSGDPNGNVKEVRSMTMKVPLVALMFTSILLGLFMPEQMQDMLHSLTDLMGGII